MPSVHATFSASAAERWANCSGALAMCQGLKSFDNEYSLEGTAGHSLAEQCFANNDSPDDHIGEVITLDANFGSGRVKHEVEVSEELADAVNTYVEYVRGISGLRLIEVKSYYSHLLGLDDDEGFGTSDAVILSGRVLNVIDLKLGRRFVNPEDNLQLGLYAAGIVDSIEEMAGAEIEEIVLHIVQPRVTPKPLTFTMTRDEIRLFIEKMKDAAQRVVEANFNYVPGLKLWEDKYLNPGPMQCQWCPAAASCNALRTRAQSVTPIDEFDTMNTLDAKSSDDLSADMKLIPLLEIWVKAIEQEVLRRITRGDKVPGYKMVLGREGNRKWGDEEAVKTAFNNAPILLAEPKLKSPAQLEAALKKIKDKDGIAKIPSLTTRNPARPTVSTADDSRPEWTEGPKAEEFPVAPQ